MLVGFDLTPAYMSGAGVGRYPRELMRALERRPDVSVAAISSSQRPPDGLPSRIAQGLLREGLYYPLLLARRAKQRGVDLVHCPATFSPRVPDRPLVLTVHDVLPFRYPELFPRVVVAHSRLVWRRAIARAQRIITGSSHTRDELVELLGASPERVAVTPYGVSERFQPLDVDRAWLGERFGLAGRFVLAVGTLEPRKNLVTTVRAFRVVSERVDDCQLAIVGGRGWRNDEFEAELGVASEHVRVLGRVGDEELVKLYAAADCFVYPSLYEGYGLPVLEAMAAGTPVVTSNTTSLPEVVGDAGLLVPPRDVGAVAAAVTTLLTDAEAAAALSRRGLERARGLSWDACAEATVAVYQDALARAA